MKLNIGALRMWLNESRITETANMVTNEDIKLFLGLIGSSEWEENTKAVKEGEKKMFKLLKKKYN